MEIENLYRSSISKRDAKPTPSISDEGDYSTLLTLKDSLDYFVKSLYNDFNAFDSANTMTAEELLVEVKARKLAYQMILPLQNLVTTKVEEVKRVT